MTTGSTTKDGKRELPLRCKMALLLNQYGLKSEEIIKLKDSELEYKFNRVFSGQPISCLVATPDSCPLRSFVSVVKE
jgi:hypothetical protein